MAADFGWYAGAKVSRAGADIAYRRNARSLPVMLAPVVIVVPTPVQAAKYWSILDFQFEINQDETQREVTEKLAVVGVFLKRYPRTTAAIEGHTDEVGTNQQIVDLLQRRAEAVVAYMVQTFDVASSRLTAMGHAETRPLTSNSTEEGKRRNEACVRPEHGDGLLRLANYIKANPTLTMTVGNPVGNLQVTSELAQQFSLRRAQNVMNCLVEDFNIDRSRLTAQGFGHVRRYSYSASGGGQGNRKVNVIINHPD